MIHDRLQKKAELAHEELIKEKTAKEIQKMKHLKHAQNIVGQPTTMLELSEQWRRKFIGAKFSKETKREKARSPVAQEAAQEGDDVSSVETNSVTDSDMEDGLSAGGGIELTEETIEVKRDSKNDFRPLEKWFGVLNPGNAFGESPFLSQAEQEHFKFYEAIAISDTTVLQITKRQYDNVLKDLSERQLRVKKTFLSDFCPEFAYLQPKPKNHICQMLERER